MQSMIILAAGECAAKCCPTHAVVALAAALAVGFAVGYVVGRRKGGKGGAKPGADKRRQQPRPPVRHDTRPPSEARPPIPAGSVELYVGNLSYDLGEDALRAEFEKFGKVDSVRLVTNRYNNKSKGFAFVVMPVRAEAERAIAEMNNKEIMGRNMRVNEAQNTNKAES